MVLRNVSPKNNINYRNTGKVMAFDVVGRAEHHERELRYPRS